MTSAALARSLHDQAEGPLAMPYAQALGIRFVRDAAGLRLVMPFAPGLIGAPGRLHGGAIAGLLELAGVATVILAQGDGGAMPRIRPITVTVDFLREGAPQDVTAAASITKLGRRIVNVRAEAWQDDRARPIAASNINVMIDWPEG